MDLSNFLVIYLRKQEYAWASKAMIPKLAVPPSCFAFANLDNFPLNFRWYRGSGEQRWIR